MHSPGSSIAGPLHSPSYLHSSGFHLEDSLDMKPNTLTLQPSSSGGGGVPLKYYMDDMRNIRTQFSPELSSPGSRRKKPPPLKGNGNIINSKGMQQNNNKRKKVGSIMQNSGLNLNTLNGSFNPNIANNVMARNHYNNYIPHEQQPQLSYSRASPLPGRSSASTTVVESPESPSISNIQHIGNGYLTQGSGNVGVIHQNSSSSGGSCFQQQLYAHSSAPDSLPPMFHHAYHHHYPPAAPSRA